jgi:hypothetical protein
VRVKKQKRAKSAEQSPSNSSSSPKRRDKDTDGLFEVWRKPTVQIPSTDGATGNLKE